MRFDQISNYHIIQSTAKLKKKEKLNTTIQAHRLAAHNLNDPDESLPYHAYT